MDTWPRNLPGILENRGNRRPSPCMAGLTAGRTLSTGGQLTMTTICLILLLTSTTALNLEHCQRPLGMQTEEIPDSAITSSSFESTNVGPANARIRLESAGGAWCPKPHITKDVYEYLQIDLGRLKVITLVETQGRFDNGEGQEFADQYMLDYQREDDGEWIRFRSRKEQEIFQGNTNTYTAEPRRVDPPIITRRIRFIPYSTHPKTVCMRVELHGCNWTDGTVSYDMHQGERRGAGIDLSDQTYDGLDQIHYLSGGLGQLTDGEEGNTNFRLDSRILGIRGYEWVGWRNDTLGQKPVELIFKFDAVRNFSSVRIHANNMYTKEVRVFGMAKLWFSVGGEYYNDKPVVFSYMRDTLMEYARQVVISIPNRVGKYVKMELFFDSKWLMISEVQFHSEYVIGNSTVEMPPTTTSATTDGPPLIVITIPPSGRERNLSRTTASRNTSDGVGLVGVTPTNPEDDAMTPETRQNLDDEYIGIIIGALAALILLLFVVIVIIILRHRRIKYNNNHRSMKSIEPRHVTLDLNDVQVAAALNGKLSNGNMYNCVAVSDGESSDREGVCCAKLEAAAREAYYQDPLDNIQTRRLPELPRTPESTDTNTSRDYAVPDMIKSSLLVNMPQFISTPQGVLPAPQPMAPSIYQTGTYGRAPKPSTLSSQRHLPNHYGTAEVGSLPSIQGVSGNTVYAVPSNLELLWKDDFAVVEFPRDNIKFVEKLGEGQFGEVHLCEALNVTDLLEDDYTVNRTNSSGAQAVLVAVKTLRHNASDTARVDFHKEVKIMARLKDPNIVRVLGVCTQEDPLCVIVEYMKYGDLNQFMRQTCMGSGTMTKRRHTKIPSYGCLIYMATQIASGMKYLETLNMVHRDLASRNCLVGSYYTIKISDFGMSRSLYSSDYYRIEGKAVLPIRWMAWESILLGKFSTKSDVWSFGVTLWEVLTYAREQPYAEFTDEQVIESCGHCYRGDGLEAILPQPHNCPKEIHDLMRECWNRDETCRPSFREIHMFLQRKNMGYNPRDPAQSQVQKAQTPTTAHSNMSLPVV